MAKGDKVAPDVAILRWAPASAVKKGIVAGAAFERSDKPRDADGLSVCRLGVFATDRVADLDCVREVLLSWRPGMKAKDWLFELRVADVIEVAAIVRQSISVIEDPLEPEDGKCANPAHALIDGMPIIGAEEGELPGLLAHDLLSQRVTADRIHPARLAV